jgi:hypothetical protein
MPTPSIQTLRADAQQVLNLDSISAVRSVVAATLANANAGTPLNPNLTTQQLWNEFYQIVTQPKSDIESIIANQLMKFLYAPPAPGGAGADKQVIFNDGGVLAGDPQFLWNKTTNLLTVTGSATITGDLTVDTSTLKVDAANNRVGVGTATPRASFALDVLGNVALGNSTTTTSNRLKLDCAGTAGNVAVMSFAAAGTTKAFYGLSGGFLGDTSTDAIVATDAAGAAIRFFVSDTGTEAMRLNSTGLGVGTSPANDKILSLGSIGILLPVSNVSDFNFRNSGGVAIQRLRYTDATGGLTIGSATATAYPVELGGSTSIRAVTIDSSLNVGIGVVPSAWGASLKAFELGAKGNALFTTTSVLDGLFMVNNAYYDTSYKYASTGYASRYTHYQGAHQWFTAPSGTAGNAITFTQAMTLDASGNLLVGTTSLISGTAAGSINIAGANSQQIIIRNTGATAGEFWRQAVDSSNTFYVLNNASTGVSITSGATSWSAVSDERLKDIIEPISNAIAKVGSLRSVIGKYKNDETNTRRSFLIAQDVLSVLPEAVDSSKSNELGLRYSEVIPLLVAAIKELTARVEALEA